MTSESAAHLARLGNAALAAVLGGIAVLADADEFPVAGFQPIAVFPRLVPVKLKLGMRERHRLFQRLILDMRVHVGADAFVPALQAEREEYPVPPLTAIVSLLDAFKR